MIVGWRPTIEIRHAKNRGARNDSCQAPKRRRKYAEQGLFKRVGF